MFAGPILSEPMVEYIEINTSMTRVGVYSDNRILVKYEIKRQDYESNYPSETLKPD